jgi:hypothetical protein
MGFEGLGVLALWFCRHSGNPSSGVACWHSLWGCDGAAAGGVRPGDRACGLCQCESGSGASLGVLPGGSGPQPLSSKPRSLTGTCVLREGGVAASGSSVSVQGRELCAE